MSPFCVLPAFARKVYPYARANTHMLKVGCGVYFSSLLLLLFFLLFIDFIYVSPFTV